MKTERNHFEIHIDNDEKMRPCWFQQNAFSWYFPGHREDPLKKPATIGWQYLIISCRAWRTPRPSQSPMEPPTSSICVLENIS